MTLLEATLATLGRAAVVAAVATVAAAPIARTLRSGVSIHLRKLIILTMAAIWLAPSLLIAYAYADFSGTLIRQPVMREISYSLLLVAKLLPIAAAVGWLAPAPPIDAAGQWCARLSPTESSVRGTITRVRIWIMGPARTAALAWAGVFLLAFTEFEIAARFVGTPSWAVWLFDAQAGVSSWAFLPKSLAMPVVIEAAVVVAALAIVWTSRPGREHAGGGRRTLGRHRGRQWGAAVLLIAALAMVLLWPIWRVMAEAWDVEAIQAAWTMRDQWGIGVMLSLGGAAAAYTLATAVRPRTIPSAITAAAVCLPGLFGSLVIAMAILWLIQRPGLDALRDTPAPLLLAHALWLLPIAMILRWAVEGLGEHRAEHAAALLSGATSKRVRGTGRSIRLRMITDGQLAVGAVLLVLAYYDVVSASLLSPTGMTPALVTVHNQMHYQSSETLSAILAVTIAIPAAVIGVAWGLRNLYAWRLSHA